jgi:membrane protease YdiL (CAAX protease family)
MDEFPTIASVRERRVDHGALLLLGIAVSLLLPPSWRIWPLPLAVPLAAYGAIVLSFAPLRSSFPGLPLGGRRAASWGLGLTISIVATASLIAFQHFETPDLEYLHRRLPIAQLGWIGVFLVFPVINAAFEEVIFRGILFSAFEARWGPLVSLIATSILFGLGHIGGYPPGVVGAVLAGVYGFSLGILRCHSKGLLVPTVTHLLADATILAILAFAGRDTGTV